LLVSGRDDEDVVGVRICDARDVEGEAAGSGVGRGEVTVDLLAEGRRRDPGPHGFAEAGGVYQDLILAVQVAELNVRVAEGWPAGAGIAEVVEELRETDRDEGKIDLTVERPSGRDPSASQPDAQDHCEGEAHTGDARDHVLLPPFA